VGGLGIVFFFLRGGFLFVGVGGVVGFGASLSPRLGKKSAYWDKRFWQGRRGYWIGKDM